MKADILSYDEGYGGFYVEDVEQALTTCRLAEDGAPVFNGILAFRIVIY